jgi:hypothetical protein
MPAAERMIPPSQRGAYHRPRPPPAIPQAYNARMQRQ